MNLRSRPRIGVMGPSKCPAQILDLARRVGRQVAQQNAILICGGMGGVMEAAAQGAKEAGGVTVGILPGSVDSEANQFIDIPIVTDMGNARNVINVLTSQVIIAIHGAYGTLSEIALALKCGTPVVGLVTWEARTPDGGMLADISVAKTPEEAVEKALHLIRNR